MKLPKPLVDQMMKLAMYQAFYEKVTQILHTDGATIDDIAEVAATLEEAMANGDFKNLPEYKKALKGEFN